MYLAEHTDNTKKENSLQSCFLKGTRYAANTDALFKFCSNEKSETWT